MSLVEKGTIMPLSKSDKTELVRGIARALRFDLREKRSMVKIIGRWTGASERAVKNWLSGRAVPSGIHLVRLMRHSNAVLEVVMTVAGRT